MFPIAFKCCILGFITIYQRALAYENEEGRHNWTVESYHEGCCSQYWHWIGRPGNHYLLSGIFIPSNWNHRIWFWRGIVWFSSKCNPHIRECFDHNGQPAEPFSHACSNHLPRSQRPSLWHHENSQRLQHSGMLNKIVASLVCIIYMIRDIW